ncbi:hypothetical protein [Vibrio jasicida]|uniref:hypothetical protein n=1 Tax=Vibrio jasicida TaxID=766224 RepID=UPI00163E59DB|nr:hypothetical protein [Vibrio jasicida]
MTTSNKPRTGRNHSKVKASAHPAKRREGRKAHPFQRIKLGVSRAEYVPSPEMQALNESASLTVKEVLASG